MSNLPEELKKNMSESIRAKKMLDLYGKLMTPKERAKKKLQSLHYVPVNPEHEEKMIRAAMTEEIRQSLSKEAKVEKINLTAERIEEIMKKVKELDTGDTWPDDFSMNDLKAYKEYLLEQERDKAQRSL